MAVNTPSADYGLTESEREITRHLRGGTRAMRAAGTTYLPTEPRETDAAYQARLMRSYLTNFYLKTSKTFNGKIFRSAPEMLEETPQEILDIKDDIDNCGNELTVFLSTALDHAIDDGVVHFFVDAPPAPARDVLATAPDASPDLAFRSKAADLADNRRPYVRIITAEQLIGWKSEVIEGTRELTQIRIAETVMQTDPEDTFNEIEVEQIRVVEPMLQSVYQLQTNPETNKQEWVIVEVVPTDFENIPLVTLYTNELKYMVGKPQFCDMAYLNVAHWQETSDQNNIVHTIRVPILFGVNLADPGEMAAIDIGPNSLVLGRAGSDLKYVEHTGKAAEVGANSIDKLEQRLVLMGSEIMMDKRSGNVTATARALDQAEEDSEMTTVSTAIENAVSGIFYWLAFGFGLPVDDTEEFPAGGINMNKDFSLGMMDVEAVKELITMRTAGDLSQATLWSELKRYGILSEDFDEEAEKALLEDESAADMANAVTQEAAMFAATAVDANGNPIQQPAPMIPGQKPAPAPAPVA